MENENTTATIAQATVPVNHLTAGNYLSVGTGESKTTSQAAPSFEELLKNKDYQSEFDRRVTKALETAKANWEKEEQVKQTEAKRLAAMNEEQKAEHKRAQAEKQSFFQTKKDNPKIPLELSLNLLYFLYLAYNSAIIQYITYG